MADTIGNLRPTSLADYVGQENVVNTLRMFLDAALRRGTGTEHLLFYGPPGIGKTTLATIIAAELKGEIKVTSGAAIQKSADLAAILTNLKDKDVLFIDEIHRMPKTVEEMLYPVMEDQVLDIIIGKGPSARTVRLPIANITIIGATTRLAMLSAPLRDRFGLILRLDYYSDDEMQKIITRSSGILKVPISQKSARQIAVRSRHTPRLANRILKRAHDIVLVDKHKDINDELLTKLFTLLELDDYGLTDIDRQYLRMIGEKFQNNPVGLETVASALSEDKQTIEEFIEPYLMQIGFIKKTPRGRILTPKALTHLNIKQLKSKDGDQQTLI